MMLSMTGYGRGEASNDHVSVVVELKSVNNRFRDLQIRCPREYLELEPRIANLLKEAVHRGRVDVSVRRVAAVPATRVVACAGLAEEYARQIAAVALRLGRDPASVDLAFILQQPGVLSLTEGDVDGAAEWTVLEPALRAAIDGLVVMRAQEGAALREELAGQLREAVDLVADIEQRAAGVNERLRVRLETRLQRMVSDVVEPSRIAQEAALLADKCDVTEELVRLRSHCERFAEALDADEPVGRRLDFLLQEMHREVNTVGSKAVEHPVSDRVVELKSTLEKIREQSANIE